MSCSSVNTVRLRRPFLVLLPPSAPCSSFPRRCRSSGRWWDAAPTCRPGAADSSGGPSGDPSEQDSGDMGNLRRLVWSAFSTERTKKKQRHTQEREFALNSGWWLFLASLVVWTVGLEGDMLGCWVPRSCRIYPAPSQWKEKFYWHSVGPYS